MTSRGSVHAHPLQGVALILLAAACFASLDSTARGLSQPDGRWGAPVLLIMTLRYTVQAVVMAVALALLGAVACASFQVLTSRLAGAESPTTTHFWTGFVGTVVLWPVLAIATASQGTQAAWTLLQRLSASAWWLMIVVGLFGTTGHLFLILALGKARTAAVDVLPE